MYIKESEVKEMREKITISLPQELMQRLEKASSSRGLTRSTLIQLALENYLPAEQEKGENVTETVKK